LRPGFESWQKNKLCALLFPFLFIDTRDDHLRPQTGEGYFWSVTRVWAPKLAVSTLSTQRLLITPELENCQQWRTCLIARGVNSIFHHKIPHTLPNHMTFGVMESL
jgi:hypothetical protein